MIWATAADTNHLSEGEVHLWRILLLQPEAVLRRCLQVLNEEEAARASRFHFERDRTRFTVARAALRSVLGHYLEIAPVDVQFRYGPQGKPELSLEHSASLLRFNLSHSGDYALLGVTRRAELGVDIEVIRPDFGTQEIAERFFSSSESRLLLDLPEEQKCESFFHCWTRKEAYIKALGGGLSIPLDSFDVAFVPGSDPALLRVAETPHEIARWRIYNLQAASGYAAAAMVEGQGHELRCWDWNAALLKSSDGR
jgi:4'-phosphopantetheinyl transferase